MTQASPASPVAGGVSIVADDRPSIVASAQARWFGVTGVLVLLSLHLGFVPIARDPDLWFHLADGRHILATHAVPDTDPFSLTRQGQLWVPHSWLFDIGVSLSWQWMGPRATEAVMAVVYMMTMMVSLGLLAARGVKPAVALGVCVALAIMAGNTRGIRPQVFSLLAFSLVVLLLVRHRYHPSRRILLTMPPIFLVWAQVHSACVMGLVAVGVWSIGRVLESVVNRSLGQPRKELITLLGALALGVLAVLVTPHAVTHFEYIALTLNITHLDRILEWQAPQALVFVGPHVYIYLLLAGVIAMCSRRVRRIGWAETALCVAMLVLGLSAIRHIPLACIGALPLVATALRGRAGGAEDDPATAFSPPMLRRSPGFVIALSCVALATLAGLWRHYGDAGERYARFEPVNGARMLAALDHPVRVFTTYNTGSFVLFAAPDTAKVFVDSRADVYGDELLEQAYRARAGIGWESLFSPWDIDAAVVGRTDGLASILAGDDGWTLVAEDAHALTFLATAR